MAFKKPKWKYPRIMIIPFTIKLARDIFIWVNLLTRRLTIEIPPDENPK